MYKLKNLTEEEELFITDKNGISFKLKPGEEKLTNSLPRDGFGSKLSIEETKEEVKPKKVKTKMED